MIVVTGVAGFIGHHLVRHLLESMQEQIIGLDNFHRGQWNDLRVCTSHGRLQLVESDVRNLAQLNKVFQNARIIFHLAAQSNVLGAVANLNYSFETNVIGTFNVLQAARAAGARCVVFTSSREVYGEQPTLPVNEDSPLIPKNAYGASKVAGEAYCRVFDSPEMRVITLRLANVYGAGDHNRVIPVFIERIRRGLPLVLYGGDQLIDFVPVELVVEAILRAAEFKPTRPVNIGSGQGTTLKQLAQHMITLSGSRVGYEIAPARSMEVVRFVADVKRMRKWLRLEPPENPLAQLPALLVG